MIGFILGAGVTFASLFFLGFIDTTAAASLKDKLATIGNTIASKFKK